MDIQYKYFGTSRVDSSAQASSMTFAPDASREPTFLCGEISKEHSVSFREAISALHSVVMSDLRYKVDNADYKVWRAEQDALELQQFFEEELSIRKIQPSEPIDAQRLLKLAKDLPELQRTSREAKSKIRELYPNTHFMVQEWELMFHAWQTMNPALASYFTPMFYDPVITVHPDKMFFECFSLDESSYGRLTCDLSMFSEIEKQATGTTNVDYSQMLYDEFQKIRSYKDTKFAIDPTGFEVQTNVDEDSYVEKKIDLPESWVRGFLQVSAAMQIPSQRIRLHPLDLHKICLFLRKNKELQGPRSIRFQLTPGQAPVALFEPWNTTIECVNSSHTAHEDTEIRIWGRRRLHLLERLIPLADHFDLYVKGAGLPYFIVAQMGAMQFTLGLSSWTANNFGSAARFDLLAPRASLSNALKTQIYETLKKTYSISVVELAKQLNIKESEASTGLNMLVQVGRAIFDMDSEEYQLRELFSDDIDLSALQFSSPEEAKAIALLQRGMLTNFVEESTTVIVEQRKEAPQTQNVTRYSAQFGRFSTVMTMDEDEEILGTHSSCNCKQDYQTRISGAPCEHILAMRLHITRPVEAIIQSGQTSLAFEGEFERSMALFREQAETLGITLIGDVNTADIILSNTTQSTYMGAGIVLTLPQWDALVATCTANEVSA